MSLTIMENKLNGTERIFANVAESWFNDKELEFLKEHEVKIISKQTREADYEKDVDDDHWEFKVYVDNKLVWSDWSGSSDYATSYIEEEIIKRYNEMTCTIEKVTKTVHVSFIETYQYDLDIEVHEGETVWDAVHEADLLIDRDKEWLKEHRDIIKLECEYEYDDTEED